jgi:DNA-binding CsgD family transcriptional regulator
LKYNFGVNCFSKANWGGEMSQKASLTRRYDDLVCVVEGAKSVDDALAKLADEARHRVCSFITGKMPSKDRLDQARERNSKIFARGVRSQTIYLNEAREHPATVDYVAWLNEQGAEVRTLPVLPTQMLIIDAQAAVLPFASRTKTQAIIIHRDPNVIYCLLALFSQNWLSATPLGRTFDSDGSELYSQERAIIELLSLGRRDREIAEEFGVSIRTVATNVSNLMERLNTKTRFAAGVQAVKRNWI